MVLETAATSFSAIDPFHFFTSLLEIWTHVSVLCFTQLHGFAVFRLLCFNTPNRRICGVLFCFPLFTKMEGICFLSPSTRVLDIRNPLLHVYLVDRHRTWKWSGIFALAFGIGNDTPDTERISFVFFDHGNLMV